MEGGADPDSEPYQPRTPTTPKTPTFPQPSVPVASSSPVHSISTTLAPSAAISGSILTSPSFTGAGGHFMYPPGMYSQLPPQIPLPTASGQVVSLETLSNQIFTLSQCVMGLSQKVSDNQRLFEENIRLKDIVIDLEFKLKDANDRVKSIDVLRESMTAQFAELNKSLQNGSRLETMMSVPESSPEGAGVYEEGGGYESVLNITNSSEPFQSDLLMPEKGTLNLQNREMTVIPDDVYKLNDPELLQNLVGSDDDLKWWETEPIAKLYLCSNKISMITPAIAGLNSLTLLDLRDNQIESVPDELSQLEVLVRLELSHNKLTSLPNTLGQALQHISLNNNNFEVMPPAISSLRALQTLDMRENRLTGLGELPCCLQSLVVDDNKLTTLHLENHQSLTAVTATNNVITSCRVGNLPLLKVLSVRVNKIEFLEPIINCPVLGEILVGKNLINNLDFVVSCADTLTVLDCSDNKISVLPESITSMSKLKRLDVSNNDLNNLPPQLALMDDLNSLAVEGNPLRAIRREIIAKGTVAIKEYLQLKLSPEDVEVSGPTIPDIQPDEIMLQTKTLEVDRKTTFSDELWDQALVCGIVRLSMQHCGLTVIPEQVVNLRGCLQELELGSNNLHQLPPEIGKLVKLRKLNLLNNNLKELPAECSSLVALEDLNLGQNKFEEIPECLYSFPAVCNLIISNNQIKSVEPAKLRTMTSLVCLDLENNNLGRLPPELSLIPNLRTLLVLGNRFKIPRADVLAKGSAEVLAWLKNKVPQS